MRTGASAALLSALLMAGCSSSATPSATAAPTKIPAGADLVAPLVFSGGLSGPATNVTGTVTCGAVGSGYKGEFTTTVAGHTYLVTMAIVDYKGPAAYAFSDLSAEPSVSVQPLNAASGGNAFLSAAGSGEMTIAAGGHSGAVDVDLIPAVAAGGADFAHISGGWSC